MSVTIEQARKATALRERLDKIDLELRARIRSGGNLSVNLSRAGPNGETSVPWIFSKAEVAAVMEAHKRRLDTERLLILAEAAEAGFVIEDAPPPVKAD